MNPDQCRPMGYAWNGGMAVTQGIMVAVGCVMDANAPYAHCMHGIYHGSWIVGGLCHRG